MFLVNVQEALGLTYEQTLDSSYTLIRAMLAEYSFMWNERNKEDGAGEDENGEYEWIDLPDWNDPSKTIRMKKYNDVGRFIGSEKIR